MTKRIAAACTLTMTLMLTACGAEDWDSTHEKNLTPKVITVNGREVTCVIYQAGNAGGLSCDWEGAR